MKNFSSSMLATGVIQVATILSGILAARLLLPYGRGELAIVILWPSMIASIGAIGLPDAVGYYAARREFLPGRVFISSLAVVVILSAVLLSIGYTVIPLVLKHHEAHLIPLAEKYLPYIPINLTGLCALGMLLGRGKITAYNVFRALVHVSYLLGIIGIYFLHRVSVASFAMVFLAANAITVLFAVIYTWREGWLAWPHEPFVAKDLLQYGVRVHVGSLASFLNARLDQMLMSIFLVPTSLGLYVVGVTISGGTYLAASTISILTFSYVANLQNHDDRCDTFARFFRLSLMMSLVSGLFIFFVAPWILRIFFGPAFVQATTATRILCLAAIALGCNGLLAAGFRAFNMPLITSIAEMLGLAVTLLGLWLLMPRYGIIGAAWASFLAYFSTLLFLVLSVKSKLGVQPLAFFKPGREDFRYYRKKLEPLWPIQTPI